MRVHLCVCVRTRAVKTSDLTVTESLLHKQWTVRGWYFYGSESDQRSRKHLRQLLQQTRTKDQTGDDKREPSGWKLCCSLMEPEFAFHRGNFHTQMTRVKQINSLSLLFLCFCPSFLYLWADCTYWKTWFSINCSSKSEFTSLPLKGENEFFLVAKRKCLIKDVNYHSFN